MTAGLVRVSPTWLELREPADAAARATDLVELLREHLPTKGRAEIHDLGCGTGSMLRWLAPRLSGSQHWLMYDRDPDLLDLVGANQPTSSADGSPVTADPRQRDITRLPDQDLSGASLITASALLDMFTVDELGRFVATCAAAHCPVLLTISVTGRVDLAPADPLDLVLTDAFNDHQRRLSDRGPLLGPDAVGIAAELFAGLGMDVTVRPSPWVLDADEAALTTQWLHGWIDAATEQRPELADAAADYAQRRLADGRARRLTVTGHHLDLLARPR